MGFCSGCSKRFDLLQDGSRCGICKRLPARELREWNACTSCGEAYEHLQPNEQCWDCVHYTDGMSLVCFGFITLTDVLLQDDDGVQQIARKAVSKPANPRTHTPQGNHTRSDPADQEVRCSIICCSAQLDISFCQLRDRAQRTLQSMGTGYQEAVARALPGVKVAPSKVKGGSSSKTSKAIPLNVRVRSSNFHIYLFILFSLAVTSI
jgi:hypothetical protein